MSMTIEERQKLAQSIFDDCLVILQSKGKDYAGAVDSLANFKRNAERLKMTKYQIWAVYFGKHVDSIMNSIKAQPEYPQVESEPLSERVKDIINYAVILAALLEDDKKEKDMPF